MSSMLAIYSLASGEVREFDPGKLGYYGWRCDGLRWSSDDRFILAEGYKGEGLHVYQINVASGQTPSWLICRVKVSPGLVSTADPEPQVVTMLREMQSIRNKVLETEPDSYLQALAVSPDGRTVAFDVRDKKTWR